jgi:hypothetical protein
LLIALLGGLAMGAVGGARRTQSSYSAFLAATNPSDLVVGTALYGLQGAKTGYDPALVTAVAHLPLVKHVESWGELNTSPLQPNGKEFHASGPGIGVANRGSITGLYINQDRISVTDGRMLDPGHVDEIVVSAPVADALRVQVGSDIAFGFYTDQAEAGPGPSGSEYRTHPYLRLEMKVVGIGLYNNAIVQDDIDALGSNFVLFSSALTRRLSTCCVQATQTGLQLEHGTRDVPTVEAELQRANPILTRLYVPAIDAAKIERAIKPDSIALGVFGLIAALATLLIASQVVGRQLRASAGDLETLRALGAGAAMTTGDGLIGVITAIVVGTILAAAVAVGISPLSPIGPVRRVYPARGIAADWTVLGLGAIVLIAVLSAVAVVFAYRAAPHRVARRSNSVAARGTRAARAAVAARLPTPAVTGVRFALEPGRGRNAVPVRSAILGAALAMVVVVSTLTFGTSLHTLVSRPALYGWNWDYALNGGGGAGAIPPDAAASALRHDHDVSAWSGYYFAGVRLDRLAVPALGGSPHASVGPPILSGNGLDAPDHVVLGASTLAELHKHVGDTVMATIANAKAIRLRIVGTATMPTMGGGGSHLEMGTGAWLSYALIPPRARNQVDNFPPGPQAIFIRLHPGANRAAARRVLDGIAASNTLSLPTNYGVNVIPVQHPAEIVNYRSISNTPLILGATLVAGAVAALALTLVTSVRRRRHDLALLKTLGFTRRQLAAVVAWQATIAVTIGTIVGIPTGIILGRTLWDLFAREIYAVPEPTVPALTIALIGVGALVLANLVAAIPGRQAARTPSALLLREE